MKKNEEVSIIGAGLVGSLLAVFLAKKGFTVSLFERRGDLRQENFSAGKSINLALANRGIAAIEEAGLWSEVAPLLIPMRGRMLHDEKGVTNFQAYGSRDSEVIYSISRGKLNSVLLNAAEKAGVKIRFHHNVTDLDLETNTLLMKNPSGDKSYHFQRIFAADGSGSKLRKILAEKHQLLTQHQEEPLDHGYKELCMPAGAHGSFALEKEALHIWPRGEYMLIALPNLDASFTVTLFLRNKGLPSFETLNNAAECKEFFAANFKDAVPLIPHLQEDFFKNPTGKLLTVKCAPWSFQDKLLLIGDAAHAIVPFHGQGMNCGFEDCSALNKCIEQEDSWVRVFSSFEDVRKANSDAIADMALENYLEMRSIVRDPQYQLKKQLAFSLEKKFPKRFIPRYSMVMFHCFPYSQAQKRGIIQEQILDSCTVGIKHLNEVDEKEVAGLVRERLTPLSF